jgi:hypothetical protein
LTGEGRFFVSQVADFQRVQLLLFTNRADPRNFHSDTAPGGADFPRIVVTASVNGMVCYDWVLDVVALPAACVADLDADGDVELDDLGRLLANFGDSSGATTADGDLDGDEDVDLQDLAELLAAFGSSCSL